ncbi:MULTISPECIES: Arm DNA-binding domain-containing protein [Sphingobacterium]|uniref:Arm DNA-binding domain-containing protein n=1 Tax=Sphingobacterium TaxID=28453 RepID=UPI0035E3C13A
MQSSPQRRLGLFHLNDVIMSTNYSLLFYLKKPKNYVNGPKPIYIRITVDGIPKEVSTGRERDPPMELQSQPCEGNHRSSKDPEQLS